MASNVVFRRLNGHVIPIGSGQAKKGVKRKAALAVAGAGAVAAGAKMSGNKRTGLKIASSVLSIASGVVSAFPFGGGLKGLAKGTAISFGLDTVATAANAAAASSGSGTKKQKLKAFAKQEVINAGLSYGALGVTLLSNPAVRKKLAQWGSRFIAKVAL
jgi:hypothetical protein